MLVVAFGSNIGNRYAYIVQAKKALQKKFGRAYKYSQVYETPAWGKEDQAAFLNSVACFSTDLPASECMQICTKTEKDLGRIRNEKWGARAIDIDILFYGGEIISEENLEIPHPEVQNRGFVLRPLIDVVPAFHHPELQIPIQELFKQFKGDKDFEPFSSCF